MPATETGHRRRRSPRSPRRASPPAAFRERTPGEPSAIAARPRHGGTGSITIIFRLYALDGPVSVSAGFDKSGLLRAMQGHILAEAELVGTYQRR